MIVVHRDNEYGWRVKQDGWDYTLNELSYLVGSTDEERANVHFILLGDRLFEAEEMDE